MHLWEHIRRLIAHAWQHHAHLFMNNKSLLNPQLSVMNMAIPIQTIYEHTWPWKLLSKRISDAASEMYYNSQATSSMTFRAKSTWYHAAVINIVSKLDCWDYSWLQRQEREGIHWHAQFSSFHPPIMSAVQLLPDVCNQQDCKIHTPSQHPDMPTYQDTIYSHVSYFTACNSSGPLRRVQQGKCNEVILWDLLCMISTLQK